MLQQLVQTWGFLRALFLFFSNVKGLVYKENEQSCKRGARNSCLGTRTIFMGEAGFEPICEGWGRRSQQVEEWAPGIANRAET